MDINANFDGWFGRSGTRGTIGDKEWKKLQERALKANPDLLSFDDKDAIRRRRIGRDNFHKRGEN